MVAGWQIIILKTFVRFVILQQKQSTRPGLENFAFKPELRF